MEALRGKQSHGRLPHVPLRAVSRFSGSAHHLDLRILGRLIDQNTRHPTDVRRTPATYVRAVVFAASVTVRGWQNSPRGCAVVADEVDLDESRRGVVPAVCALFVRSIDLVSHNGA